MVEDMIQLLGKRDKLDITKKRGERNLMIEHESIILTQTWCLRTFVPFAGRSGTQ